jgi:hypothetical protein
MDILGALAWNLPSLERLVMKEAGLASRQFENVKGVGVES